MTTMLSLILAFMLSIGGSPAASVNPAGCPGDTGIQAPIDNNRTIKHFSEDYNQKTASRAKSKKTGKTPSIKDIETSSSIMFSRFSIEKLRQARYFDHKSYRFNSVDPIINREEALYNPQLWNLYAYCRNNPITYLDPDGKRESPYFTGRWRQYLYNKWANEGGNEYADQKQSELYASDFKGAIIAGGIIISIITKSILADAITVEEMRDSSKRGERTKGRSKVYERKGGIDQANKDFDSLNPKNVRSYDDGKRVGELKDGRTIILREKSKEGRPTLEIQKGKNKIKFRYDKD